MLNDYMTQNNGVHTLRSRIVMDWPDVSSKESSEPLRLDWKLLVLPNSVLLPSAGGGAGAVILFTETLELTIPSA